MNPCRASSAMIVKRCKHNLKPHLIYLPQSSNDLFIGSTLKKILLFNLTKEKMVI